MVASLAQTSQAKNQTRGFLHDKLEIYHPMCLVHAHIESSCSHMRGAFRNAEFDGTRASGGPSRCAPRLADGSEVDKTDTQRTQVDVDLREVAFLFV